MLSHLDTCLASFTVELGLPSLTHCPAGKSTRQTCFLSHVVCHFYTGVSSGKIMTFLIIALISWQMKWFCFQEVATTQHVMDNEKNILFPCCKFIYFPRFSFHSLALPVLIPVLFQEWKEIVTCSLYSRKSLLLFFLNVWQELAVVYRMFPLITRLSALD